MIETPHKIPNRWYAIGVRLIVLGPNCIFGWIMNQVLWLLRVTSMHFFLGMMVMLSSRNVHADWPGLLGSQRNGHADADCNLPDQISGAPKQVWKLDAGEGFAGAAIAENDVVLFDRVGKNDRVRLVQAANGKEVWKREIPATYVGGGFNPDRGPRCVPTITQDHVVIYSASGELSVLSRSKGTVLWTQALRKQYQAEDGFFGAGSTPLVAMDRIITNVGGKKASVVCHALRDGKVLWTAHQGEASYASPVIYPVRDKDTTQYVVVVPTRYETLGIELETGKVLWKVPFGMRGPTVNAATPILLPNDRVFLTASYGIGSLTIQTQANTASVLTKSDAISSQYATPIVLGDRLFGCDGREDGGTATLKCLNSSDGSLIWQQENMPICHTIGVGKHLLVCGIDGSIWCVAPESSKFDAKWTTQLPRGNYRAIPAFSKNRLLMRNCDGSGAWYCYEFL